MITFQGKEVHLRHKRLNVNDTLPSFTIVKNDLSEIKSDDTKGIRVFLSVPSLDTGVCSMEVAKFMQYFQGDQKLTCYAISMDLPFALDRSCICNDLCRPVYRFLYHQYPDPNNAHAA